MRLRRFCNCTVVVSGCFCTNRETACTTERGRSSPEQESIVALGPCESNRWTSVSKELWPEASASFIGYRESCKTVLRLFRDSPHLVATQRLMLQLHAR